jgi:hypothetical protein
VEERKSRRDSEPLDLAQNSRQPSDLSRGARGLNPHKQRSESPEGVSYRDFDIREFGSPEDKVRALDIRSPEIAKGDLSRPSAGGRVSRESSHFGDSGIGTHRGEHLDFASGEVAKKDQIIGKRTIHLRRTGGSHRGKSTSRVAKSLRRTGGESRLRTRRFAR